LLLAGELRYFDKNQGQSLLALHGDVARMLAALMRRPRGTRKTMRSGSLESSTPRILDPSRNACSWPIPEVAQRVHDLPAVASLVPGIGVRGAVGFVGEGLEDRYGTRFPVGAMVFVRLTPAPMRMAPSHMSGMTH